MYNYMDYDNDRVRVRQRFLKEMDKRVTLKDIGEMLDKFIIDEKAEGLQYYDPTIKETVKETMQDHNSFEMTWSGRLMKSRDPLTTCKLITILYNLYSVDGRPIPLDEG